MGVDFHTALTAVISLTEYRVPSYFRYFCFLLQVVSYVCRLSRCYFVGYSNIPWYLFIVKNENTLQL